MTTSAQLQPACATFLCDLYDVPTIHGQSTCPTCGGPMLLPECPPWCQHEQRALDAGLFLHSRTIGQSETATVEMLQAGDASSPQGPIDVALRIGSDHSMLTSGAAQLREIAQVLADAADELARQGPGQ